MTDGILYIWIIFLVIFLAINLYGKSNIFGIIVGFWLALMGLGILVDGIQVQTGLTVTHVNNTNITVYDYSDLVLPFSTYSYVWGVIFLAISLYVIYANAMERITG